MLIAITNRKLCRDSFTARLELIARAHPEAIMLREKDMSEPEYLELALACVRVCGVVPVIGHSFPDAARKAGLTWLQLPYSDFICMTGTGHLSGFERVGVSVHSQDEAIEAVRQGASYLVAGHIFDTDCKRGVKPRGLDFLKKLCESVKAPVYAVGGITPCNAQSVLNCGASGVCVMSALMLSDCPEEDTAEYIRACRAEGGVGIHRELSKN